MSYTQPICRPCFSIKHPSREPVRVRDDESRTCCLCGDPTVTGIYIRINPATVPFPMSWPEDS